MKIIKINIKKYIFDRLKDNRKEKILKNLFIKYARLKPNNYIESYFTRWRYINKRLDQINNAKIIQRFCKMQLRNRNIIKKWKKLYLLLKDKDRKNNTKDILNKIKKYIGIIRLVNALNNKRKIHYKSYIAFFFDNFGKLLNNLKNQDYSYQILKRVIIKQNNKKKKKKIEKSN